MRLNIPLTLLSMLLLSSCLKHELQRGLSEQESQEIIVLLEEHGLRAVRKQELEGQGQQKGPAGYTVYVQGGSQQLVQAWRVLQQNGLPRERVRGLEQVFENSGLIPTAGEEKARLLAGLAGELSRTLQSIPGVVDARVHVVIPENSPLVDRAEWKPTTSSVLLKYQGNNRPLGEEQIRLLVAKGVEGLLPENVAVVYHKVTPKPPPPPTLWWYLGNEVLLVAALVLAVVSTTTSLALVARTRRQRSQIEMLRSQVTGGGELQTTRVG